MNKKRILVTAGLIVTTIIALTYGIYSSTEKKKLLSVEQELKRVVETQSLEIRTFLDTQNTIFYETFNEELFVQLVTLDSEDEPYGAVFTSVMNTLQKSSALANGIADASGIVVAHTASFLMGKDISKTPDFQKDINRDTTDLLVSVIPSSIPQNYLLGFRRPLFDKGQNSVGVAGMAFSLNELAKITGALDTLGKTAETYLVNNDRLLITPSRFLQGENKGVLIQAVETEITDRCFSEKKDTSKSNKSEIVYALDYRGEDVIGTYIRIPKTDWCLVAKIDMSEAGGVLSSMLKILK